MNDATDPAQDEPQDREKQVSQILGEAHMILPGLLSLLGLQIISVFNPVFQEELEPTDHVVHLVALTLLALGVALVVTPAAYHRKVSPSGIPGNFAHVATTFVRLAMIPLMLAIALDVYLVSFLALKSTPLCLTLSASLLTLFASLWFVYPGVVARRLDRNRERRPQER